MYVNKLNKYGLARAAGLLLYEYNMASGCDIAYLENLLNEKHI